MEASQAPIGPKAVRESVATKAVLKAADRLIISNAALAKIIGVSEATVSRMRAGQHRLEPGKKPFELALLVVRMYRALDAIVGGDDRIASKWLRNQNTALGAAPIELVGTVMGLTHVIDYLDTRRAVI